MPRLPLLFLLLPLLAGAPAQAAKLRPVDEAKKDPSFLAFRRSLLDAVRRRDRKVLLAAVHPRIKNGFGGDDGRAGFVHMWRLDAKDSPLWEELRRVLELGGKFTTEGGTRQFWAPYVYAVEWPAGPWSRDVNLQYAAVTGNAVPLRSKADPGAPAAATLSYDIVQLLDEWKAGARWRRVQAPGGRTGFVAASSLRTQTDYRAGFEKKAGRWQMTFLGAGD